MQIALQDHKNIETLLEEAIAQYLETHSTHQPAPNPIDPRNLSGILHNPNRQTVSLAEMDAGIAECAGESA
jgi:predicted transcriptional regulator